MGCCISSPYNNVTYETTQKFIPPIKEGKVVKVYDGDTITIATYIKGLSKNTVYRFPVRIKHIDAPELRSSNIVEKQVAIIARDQLAKLIQNKVVTLHNITYEKYGRLCCDVFYGPTNISEYMLEKRLAVKYEGRLKYPPTNWLIYYKHGRR